VTDNFSGRVATGGVGAGCAIGSTVSGWSSSAAKRT